MFSKSLTVYFFHLVFRKDKTIVKEIILTKFFVTELIVKFHNYLLCQPNITKVNNLDIYDIS